mgnify:CR=1 FL=1
MAGAADTADKIYRGIAVSPGICRAEILVLDRGHEEAPHRRPVPPARIPVEIERLEQALTDTRQQIREVQQKVRNRIGSDAAKLFAAPVGKRVADAAMQVMGGSGYCREYPVERLWRDAKLIEIGGGTLESHQKNLTKDLSAKYRL